MFGVMCIICAASVELTLCGFIALVNKVPCQYGTIKHRSAVRFVKTTSKVP